MNKRLLLGYSDEDFETLFMRGELNFDILGSNEDFTWEVNALGDLELNKDGVVIATFDTDKVDITNLQVNDLSLGTVGKGQVVRDANGTGILSLQPPNELSTKLFIRGVTETEIETLGFAGLVSSGFDEALVLENFMTNVSNVLTNMGFNNEAPLKIIVESERGYIFMNGKCRIPDRVSLEFKSPVVIGNLFTLRMHGSTIKEPNALVDSPTIDGVFADGVSTFTFVTNGFAGVAGLPWASGDLMNIRDNSADASINRIIQSIALVSGTQFTVTLTEPINFTTEVGDQFRRFQQASLSSTTLRGDSRLVFATGQGDFDETDYIHILDNRKAGDFTGNHNETSAGLKFWFSNNLFRFESAKIIRNDGSTFYLDRPLSHDYDSLTDTYIIQVQPRQKQTIENMMIIQIEAPEQDGGVNVRNNTHLIHLEDCIDCKVINCTFTDSYSQLIGIQQFVSIENVIRVRECYHCEILNCVIDRSRRDFSSSGGSYGFTLYFSTGCNIIGGSTSSLRHNILLQGATSCSISNIVINNPLISGLDLHGLGSRDNHFHNIKININGVPSLDNTNTLAGNSTIAGLRVGNSFHPAGDDYNDFNDIIINIGNVADTDISSVIGIEIEAPSHNNIFRNCRITGTSQTGSESAFGIVIKDYDRERLLNKLQDNQFIDCYVENMEDGAVFLDGEASYANSTFAFNTGTFIEDAVSTTVVTLPVTLSNAPSCCDPLTYEDYFGGGNVKFQFGDVARNWTLRFTSGTESGNNHTITDYVASSRQATITPAISNVGIDTDTFELYDSFTTISSLPIENTKFYGNKFIRNNKLVLSKGTRDTAFISNNFDTNVVKDTGDKYTFDVDADTDFRIMANTTYNVSRFVKMTDQTNIKIFSNKVLEPIENTVLQTEGTNTLEFGDNVWVGFNQSFTLNGADTYTTLRDRIGYNSTASGIGIVMKNDSGRVGIGINSPTEALDVVGSINISGSYLVGGVEIAVGNSPYFSAIRDTNAQTISNASNTTVTFDSIQSNRGGFSESSGAVTVPSTGLYNVSYSILFLNNSTGQRVTFIQESTGLEHRARLTVDATASLGTFLSSSYVANITNTSNTISLRVFQNSGGNLDIGLAGTEMYLRITRIGSSV